MAAKPDRGKRASLSVTRAKLLFVTYTLSQLYNAAGNAVHRDITRNRIL